MSYDNNPPFLQTFTHPLPPPNLRNCCGAAGKYYRGVCNFKLPHDEVDDRSRDLLVHYFPQDFNVGKMSVGQIFLIRKESYIIILTST